MPKSSNLDDAERAYIDKLIARIGRRRIRAKKCWANAQRLILEDEERRLEYWESGLHVPHAWVTINGKIVDVTAEAADRKFRRKFGKNVDMTYLSSEYRGLSVHWRAVLENQRITNEYGPVLGERWSFPSAPFSRLSRTRGAKLES